MWRFYMGSDAIFIAAKEKIQVDEGLANQIVEADFSLYPGCTTYTELSITIELYRHKMVNGVSRKAFDELLKITGSMYPPRWKEETSNMEYDDMIDRPKKKIPVKQLIWHATHKSKDGKIRHPSDSLAWKHTDTKFPEFASESRNLRLGLAADGFNPFGDISPTHSFWQVLIVVYNLPPQQCMQDENIILSLLIPGKKQPGRDIDIYLQPLIDDLIELWDNGVEFYDKFSKTMFNLKALLMRTINDFPSYGNLSGCTYKGKAACPLCGDNTLSNWLSFSRKISIIVNDFWKVKQNEAEKRKDKDDKKKNNKKNNQKKVQSSAATGANDGNSKCEKRKRAVATDACSSAAATSGTQDADHLIFNKQSIFFDFPYWKVRESVIGTILNINFKTKDGLNSRNDLKSMGIREDLHPTLKNGKTWLPPAPYNLRDKGKAIFYNRMRNFKVSSGYSSDLRRHFSKDGCLGVLKAHDYHVLMQQILPVALKGLLPDGTSTAKKQLKCNVLIVKGWSVADKADEGRVDQSRHEDNQHASTTAGRPLSKGARVCIDSDMLNIAHRYVLFNTTEIDPYRTMHMDELSSYDTSSDENQLISIHSETFADWIRLKVKMKISQGISVSNTVEWLAYGPLDNCVSYKGLEINGSRFITKDFQRVTQNSGVSIESKSLVAGRSQMSGFYGVLKQILVLDYQHMFQIPIFKCDWAHTYFGVKIEKGYTLVNLRQHKNQYQNDPFILASQAPQVFYSRESDTSNWFVMLKPPPRGFHELEEYNEQEDTSCHPVDPSTLVSQMDDETESCERTDDEPILVVPTKKKNKKNKKKKNKYH
ncbi:uncharacterized protein LOC113304952 [Papaver somniferum]|uniref:uncharacterized protein LOC113304952 n=1 Tax=Papaver somniferum TaxID=3469 RepID=UPI000E700314|nr:uncharacterized protein LOC113304952 [Papaver somniferum]